MILLNEKDMMEQPHQEKSLDELLSELDAQEKAWAEEKANASAAKKTFYAKPPKGKWQGTVLMYLHDLTCLLAGLILVFLLLFRVVVVSGTSMTDTLLDGDYLLLLGSTLYQDPKQGDIIVASKKSFDNGDPIVKRVIATEGQWVDIDFDAGIVYVGDTQDSMVALEEPYTRTLTNTKWDVEFPLNVDEGCLFVLGDNRNGSKDSRDSEIGLIDKREVLGKVIFLFYPGTNHDTVDRDFKRIGVVNG